MSDITPTASQKLIAEQAEIIERQNRELSTARKVAAKSSIKNAALEKQVAELRMPSEDKTYCLKHYRQTFPSKGCDMCELEAERDKLREAAQAVVTSGIQHSKDLVVLAALLEQEGRE